MTQCVCLHLVLIIVPALLPREKGLGLGSRVSLSAEMHSPRAFYFPLSGSLWTLFCALTGPCQRILMPSFEILFANTMSFFRGLRASSRKMTAAGAELFISASP